MCTRPHQQSHNLAKKYSTGVLEHMLSVPGIRHGKDFLDNTWSAGALDAAMLFAHSCIVQSSVAAYRAQLGRVLTLSWCHVPGCNLH